MGRENSKYGNEEMLMFFFLEAPSKNFFDKFFDNFFDIFYLLLKKLR